MEGLYGRLHCQRAHVLDVINQSRGRVHPRFRAQAAGHAKPDEIMIRRSQHVKARPTPCGATPLKTFSQYKTLS
jgi:hypothetical protein